MWNLPYCEEAQPHRSQGECSGRLSPSARSLPDATLAGALQSQEGLSILLGLTEKSLTPLWGLVLYYLLGKKTGPEVAPTPYSHLGPLLSLIFFPGFS